MMTFDRIVEAPTERFSSGNEKLDRLFGSTRTYDGHGQVLDEVHGIPRRKIIVLGGEEGVGKTKWYTDLIIDLIDKQNLRAVIGQMEMDGGEYKAMFLQMCRSKGLGSPSWLDRLAFEKSRDIKDHIQVINDFHPDIYVADSFNMIEGHNTRGGIDAIVFGLKEVIIRKGTCAMIVAHLDKKKGTVKGNNRLPYMVDGVSFLKRANVPIVMSEADNLLRIKNRIRLLNGKNRGGEGGMEVFYEHRGDDLVEIEAPVGELFDAKTLKNRAKIKVSKTSKTSSPVYFAL